MNWPTPEAHLPNLRWIEIYKDYQLYLLEGEPPDWMPYQKCWGLEGDDIEPALAFAGL